MRQFSLAADEASRCFGDGVDRQAHWLHSLPQTLCRRKASVESCECLCGVVQVLLALQRKAVLCGTERGCCYFGVIRPSPVRYKWMTSPAAFTPTHTDAFHLSPSHLTSHTTSSILLVCLSFLPPLYLLTRADPAYTYKHAYSESTSRLSHNVSCACGTSYRSHDEDMRQPSH